MPLQNIERGNMTSKMEDLKSITGYKVIPA